MGTASIRVHWERLGQAPRDAEPSRGRTLDDVHLDAQRLQEAKRRRREQVAADLAFYRELDRQRARVRDRESREGEPAAARGSRRPVRPPQWALDGVPPWQHLGLPPPAPAPGGTGRNAGWGPEEAGGAAPGPPERSTPP